MSRLTIVIIAIAAAGLGLGVGWWASAPAEREPHTAPAPQHDSYLPSPAATAWDRAALRADLRAVLAAPPSSTAEPRRPAGAPAPKDGDAHERDAPTSDQLAAAEQGHVLLDDALDRTRWDHAAAADLRALLPQMRHQERVEVLARLAAAVNRDELMLDSAHPLWP